VKRSEARILTTHAGSLPRTQELTALLVRASRGEAIDPAERDKAALDATRKCVARQLEVGIDVGNNGEAPRESFFTYVRERMTGFGGQSTRALMSDLLAYPGYLERRLGQRARLKYVDLLRAPQAIGPVRYADRGPLEREVAEFRRILGEQPGAFIEPFLTAPSPGIIATAMQNAHYPNLEDYVLAVARALRSEYEHITRSGFLLQLDCPDLAMERHTLFAGKPLDEFLRFVDRVVDEINAALAEVPPERVRMHVCWGNYEGPHDRDVPLEAILPHLLRARVGGWMLALANPRHTHEVRLLRGDVLPPDAVLVAGVIDTTTNYVEHPEVVADRIERAAEAVGDPHRVIAGTDCGFDTSAGIGGVAEDVVWAKLRALRDGADLATRRLLD
jgi:5-methyltetrahydropteroyltriglutamate--homocysteine methyltransferase